MAVMAVIASEMPCAVISHTSHYKSRRSHLQTSSSFLKGGKHSSVIACFNRRQPCASSHHELLPLRRCSSLACTSSKLQHNTTMLTRTHPAHVTCFAHGTCLVRRAIRLFAAYRARLPPIHVDARDAVRQAQAARGRDVGGGVAAPPRVMFDGGGICPICIDALTHKIVTNCG